MLILRLSRTDAEYEYSRSLCSTETGDLLKLWPRRHSGLASNVSQNVIIRCLNDSRNDGGGATTNPAPRSQPIQL